MKKVSLIPGGTTAYSLALIVLLAAGQLIAAKPKTRQGVLKANPPQYAPFAQALTPQQQINHLLERLTFGARPGNADAVQRKGLTKWIEAQLHPERIPEDPALEVSLKPFDSYEMSPREAYLEFPSAQLIAQVARGKAQPPDDPELRTIVLQLAQRYRLKQEAKADALPAPARMLDATTEATDRNPSQPAQSPMAEADTKKPNPGDDSDLEPLIQLSSVLTPSQIDVLHHGRPQEKTALLRSIPANKINDFIFALNRHQRQSLYNIAPVDIRRKLMRTVNPQQVVAEDLVQQKMLRAIYSNRQLNELLVDFWYNHFNVYLNKAADRYLVPTYERDAIRPHVFGKFYDLLLATAKSPAMLIYLDNALSVGPVPASRQQANPLNRKLRAGLNENYGRELLELHTLGVDGGYTQQDVINVARCFTGWTVSAPRKGAGFEYTDRVHDKGEKTVLGHTIKAGGGMDDGLKVLEILARQPATAHFISLKLAKRFVADDPPPSLVQHMEKTFADSDGDLRAVMKAMLESPEFWSQGAYRAKVKTPFEMVVSSVRASSAQVNSAVQLAGEVQRLGEPLYRKIEPTGYSSANAEWVSSASLLERMNFAISLAHNRLQGVSIDLEKWDSQVKQDPFAIARDLLMEDPSEQTRQAISKTLKDPALQQELAAGAQVNKPEVSSLIAGLVIGSPEFQRR
jgi:uncharacterized protein (DUF1800 family)